MDQTVKALSDLTGAPPWPDRWLSLPEFAAELDRAGFWGRVGMGDLPQRESSPSWPAPSARWTGRACRSGRN